MDQELITADNRLDEMTPENFTGAQLYYYGMNLPEDNWINVRYDSVKKAAAAANVCGNKCRLEDTKNVFTIRRQQDSTGTVWLVITKVSNTIKLQQSYMNVKSIARSTEAELTKLEEAADAAGYEVDEERLLAFQLTDAVQLLQEGKDNTFILSRGIGIDTLLLAKAKVEELRRPKYNVEFLPGADDDWDKTDWSEEEVRNHAVTYNWIVHCCEKGKDPIVAATEGRLTLTVVTTIYEEVQTAAAAKAKTLRKAALENDKKLNPEKYQPKVKEMPNETA